MIKPPAARVPAPADALSVQQLRSFCNVVDRQSYTAVSKMTGHSTPTLWQHVRAVERRYGVRLFERRGRRIVPTNAAITLRRAVEPLLAGLDSTFDLLREPDGRPPAPITLVAGVRMLLEELSDAVARFHARRPHVPLRLLHADNLTAQAMVADRRADLALTLEPTRGQAHDLLEYQPAYEIDHLAVAPRRHAMSRLRSVRPQDLVRWPLVLGHNQAFSRQLLEQALHQRGLLSQMRIAAETDNSAFTAACVRRGMGVGVLAGRPDGPLIKAMTVRSLRPWLGQARIVIALRRGAYATPAARELLQILALC